jgi:RNA polymerase sigma-70 factor (ECF subfamily)
LEDAQIIELYFSRSENAIAETRRKYEDYIVAISENILQNRQDAEECVNDAYAHVWNSIPPQNPLCFRAFLGSITRNLSLDCYKKRNTQKRSGNNNALLLSELEECIPSPANVEREFDDSEIAKYISEFLHGQTEQNRALFVRRYWHCDSVKQISKRLGLSESKIKSSLFRLRNSLKVYLEKEGVKL